MKNYSVEVWDVNDKVWCKIAFAEGVKMDYKTASSKFWELYEKHPLGNVRLMNNDLCVCHNWA